MSFRFHPVTNPPGVGAAASAALAPGSVPAVATLAVVTLLVVLAVVAFAGRRGASALSDGGTWATVSDAPRSLARLVEQAARVRTVKEKRT